MWTSPLGSIQLQLSPFRSFAFDSAVIVLLSDRDYSVWRAAKIPAGIVEAAGVHNNHVNGKVVFARKELMEHPEAEDVTDLLRAIQMAETPKRDVPSPGRPQHGSDVSRPLFHAGMTVEIGYTNPNQQTVREATGLPGTDHGQSVYILSCGHCGHQYGSNGSDNHRRRCPSCQGGRPGLRHR
jgi:hypothetical protein